MGEVSIIGLDLARTVFQAHGADSSGAVVFRKKLRRDQLLAFFAGAWVSVDGDIADRHCNLVFHLRPQGSEPVSLRG